MTKSTTTRDELNEVIATYGKHHIAHRMANVLLAAMDSEPVILYRERNPYNGLTTGWQELTENEFSFLKENAGENAEFLTLYRHAQPDISHLSRICAECTHVWYHGKKYNGKKRSHCLRCGKVEYQLEGNLAAPEVECPHEWVAYGMYKDKGTGVFATLCRCRLCGLRSRAGVIESLQEVQQEIKS